MKLLANFSSASILLHYLTFLNFHGVRVVHSQQCWQTQLKTHPKRITSNNPIFFASCPRTRARTHLNLVHTLYTVHLKNDNVCMCSVCIYASSIWYCFCVDSFFSSIDKTDTQEEEKQKTNKKSNNNVNQRIVRQTVFFCWGATCEVIDLSYVFNDVYSTVQCSTR